MGQPVWRSLDLGPFPIFPNRNFSQARKYRDGKDSEKEHARARRHDVGGRKCNVDRGRHEGRPNNVTMQPAAATRIHEASDAHDQKSRNPKPGAYARPGGADDHCRNR